MSLTVSNNYRVNTSITGGELPINLLIFRHPNIAQPLRLVTDMVDIVSKGNTYTAFDVKPILPQQGASLKPYFTLVVNNAERQFQPFLARTKGAKDVSVDIIQIVRSTPDIWEIQLPFSVLSTKLTNQQVAFEIGIKDSSLLPGLPILYNSQNTPGIV